MEDKTLNEITVCSADELTNGKRKVIQFNNTSVVVVNSDNNLYAFRNYCPHQGAPLEFGSISGAMESSEPHKYKYGCHNQVVRCPLHGWAFDMKDGHSLFNSKVKIKTFEVKEREGIIILLVKGKPEKITVSDVLTTTCG
ncbi:Rieske (2Fe-2S) protein [Bacillus sp. FJAT-29790]|uniref:Rieske (2Fe-2S) protein n=1 Tax=Bacillus sp. FJAT-29790 TaxID=1895002 RepID=UPI001C2248EF|nr:Rieske (2Fe-2S) protein [Bacillus sp. FJAT-29790]